MTFTPRLEVLPTEQRELWPYLKPIADSFVLYGGTALALRLGHRVSVDFDFFSSESLDFDGLFAIPLIRDAELLQRDPGTLTISTRNESANPVKLSFFGGIDTGRVGTPERTDDNVIWVASKLDLLATKLKVLLQRVAARDYVDIAALLQSGESLADGLGAAVALYGNEFPPVEAVKALGYFEGGDAENVDAASRRVLLGQIAAWDHTVSVVRKVADRRLGLGLSSP